MLWMHLVDWIDVYNQFILNKEDCSVGGPESIRGKALGAELRLLGRRNSSCGLQFQLMLGSSKPFLMLFAIDYGLAQPTPLDMKPIPFNESFNIYILLILFPWWNLNGYSQVHIHLWLSVHDALNFLSLWNVPHFLRWYTLPWSLVCLILR